MATSVATPLGKAGKKSSVKTVDEQVTHIDSCFAVRNKSDSRWNSKEQLQLPLHRVGHITYIDVDKRRFGVDLNIGGQSRRQILQSLEKTYFKAPQKENDKSLKQSKDRNQLKRCMNQGRRAPIVGNFYAAFISDFAVVARVKVTEKISSVRYNVRLIDYGTEAVVEMGDIGPLPAEFSTYLACALSCELPNEHLMSVCQFPSLDDLSVGCAVEVYVLSAQEPCLAVVGSRIRPHKIKTATFLDGIDPSNLENVLLFLTSTQLPNVPQLGKGWAATYWMHRNQPALVSTVAVTEDLKVAVRDVLSSLRFVALSEVLLRDYSKVEYRKAMFYDPHMVTPGIPVVVFWKDQKAFIRGTVTRVSFQDNVCDVEAVDIPDITLTKIPFAFLFGVSSWLLGVPPQITYIDLIPRPEDSILHYTMPLIKELLEPERLLIVKQHHADFDFDITTMENVNVREFLIQNLDRMSPMDGLLKENREKLEEMKGVVISKIKAEVEKELAFFRNAPKNCYENPPPAFGGVSPDWGNKA